RVDTLLRDLLNLTQARPLNRMPTPVEPLLAECAHLHEELASAGRHAAARPPQPDPGAAAQPDAHAGRAAPGRVR
ncbi:two-component sensor histidine kinase, partial [Methylobacterium radiotolerans]